MDKNTKVDETKNNQPFSLKDFVSKNFNLIAIAIFIIALYYFSRRPRQIMSNVAQLGGAINTF